MAAEPQATEIEHLMELAGVDICPIPLLTPLSKEIARLTDVFENGLYPYPGAYHDQLAIFVQGAGVIGSERNAIRKARQGERGR